jgi:hypothetical protein
MDIYHDNGAAFGRRTRFFRDCATGGVEWIYAVEYAGGATCWKTFYPGSGLHIAGLKDGGMFLSRLENAAA